MRDQGLGPLFAALGTMLTVGGFVVILTAPRLLTIFVLDIDHADERVLFGAACMTIIGGILLGCGVYSLTSGRREN